MSEALKAYGEKIYARVKTKKEFRKAFYLVAEQMLSVVDEKGVPKYMQLKFGASPVGDNDEFLWKIEIDDNPLNNSMLHYLLFKREIMEKEFREKSEAGNDK